MGIITECQELALGLRKTLWGLHTKNDPIANPETPLISFKQLEEVYNQWKELMQNNQRAKKDGQKPEQPLTQFTRQKIVFGDLD